MYKQHDDNTGALSGFSASTSMHCRVAVLGENRVGTMVTLAIGDVTMANKYQKMFFVLAVQW